MEFERDEDKNLSNIRKHGIGFAKAQRIFEGEEITVVDYRFHYTEVRENSIGMVDGVLLLMVSHTDTETGKIRLISARKATKIERVRYEKTLR